MPFYIIKRFCGRKLRLFTILLLQLFFTVAVFVLYRLYTKDLLISPKQKVIYIGRDSQYYKHVNNSSIQSQRQNTHAPPRLLTVHTLNTKKPEKDMVNDYQPYVDFRFEYPQIQPKINDSKDVYLVVLVNSGSKGNEFRQRRSKIRETWASRKTCEFAMTNSKVKELKKLHWILVFVLGKARNEEDQQNIEEAKKHNDMIIGDITDNYLNNILKFYMGQLWASLLGAKYTLKTDDDVYVRIPKVIEYLVSEGSPSRFYGGGTYLRSAVMRHPGGKWSISKKYFAEKVFPPFNAGAFILLSTDLLGELMNYVHIGKPFHTDDAYIGVAIRHLKVKVVHILSFVIENNMDALVHKKDNCYILKILAYGHNVHPGGMDHVHKRLEDLCHANATLQALKCKA